MFCNMSLVMITFTAVQVTFEGAEMVQLFNESSAVIRVCLNLSHSDLQREITVTISTEEGNANGRV